MTRAVILSGAGLSAESGIQTFRAQNGLWNDYDVNIVCNIHSLEDNMREVFDFYNARRQELGRVQPNNAHLALAALQRDFGPEEIVLVTQNVDDLLERVGAVEVRHLHGKLWELECRKCRHVWDIGYTAVAPDTTCPNCHAMAVKPNVVFFGEPLLNFKPMLTRALDKLREQGVFAVIGTSGFTLPVEDMAAILPAYTILNNLETSRHIDEAVFDEVLHIPATEAVSRICNVVRGAKRLVQQGVLFAGTT